MPQCQSASLRLSGQEVRPKPFARPVQLLGHETVRAAWPVWPLARL